MAQVWDGLNLQLTFRRCVDEHTLNLWNEMQDLVKGFSPSNDLDKPVWSLDSKGFYSAKYMYKMINFGGITSVWKDYIWRIKVPPNIHVFLWLMVHNKSLTRDNLSKRQHVEDLTCVFCNDLERKYTTFII